MNIVQLNKIVKQVANCVELVHSYSDSSPYEYWNTENVKYGSICFCIKKTRMRSNTTEYTALLYYGDRLLQDGSNKNEVWSNANDVLQNIIGTLNYTSDGSVSVAYPYDITHFEQKFADNLAGAYAQVVITVAGIGECGNLLYGYEASQEDIKLESIVKTFTVNGEYDIVPSEDYDAISDVKVVVDIPLQEKSIEITQNGHYNVSPDEGYEGVTNVDIDVEIPLQSKSVNIDDNGSYTITPDEGYEGVTNVDINVDIPLQEKSVKFVEAGFYEVVPDDDYKALTKVNVEVSLEGKQSVPNGFRFTGGDMALVEWDKYDWSMVYDTAYFFQNCSFSDDGWGERFKSGFNGEIWGGDNMFCDCTSLTSIPQLDTSNVVCMNNMFDNCTSLTSIPQLDTSKVTNMSNMFLNCYNLTTIPQLGTSKVTNMYYMFGYCSSLTSIPQLDTSKVTNMSNMFIGCRSLTTIPQLETSNVTNMRQMFEDCYNLTSIPQLDTSKVTDMLNMFNGCRSLTTIPQLDTSKVTNMRQMFSYCYSLTSIPQLDTSKVTDMLNMFNDCRSLTSIPLFDCSSTTTSTAPFGYSELTQLTDLGGFKNLKTSWTLNSLDKVPNATVESLMNVINNLYDLTANGLSGKSIKFGTTNLNKLTDEQKAVATAKGWTLTT